MIVDYKEKDELVVLAACRDVEGEDNYDFAVDYIKEESSEEEPSDVNDNDDEIKETYDNNLAEKKRPTIMVIPGLFDNDEVIDEKDDSVD